VVEDFSDFSIDFERLLGRAFVERPAVLVSTSSTTPPGLSHRVLNRWAEEGVELVETSTRRTLNERTTEQAFESIEKSEKSSTTEDELSDAVRSENGANTKLGVTLNSTGSYGVVGFVDGSTTVGNQLRCRTVQQGGTRADPSVAAPADREALKRDQKELQVELKTVTENTDTRAVRYVINNTTQDLINYELRARCGQSRVQVQDYGVQTLLAGIC